MELLLVSNILLWVLVVVMAVIIYALTRQIGVLYERIAPAGALAMNRQIKIGSESPVVAVSAIQGRLDSIGGQPADRRARMLFFLSPDCPVCKTLLPALKSIAKAEKDWLDVICASDGMEFDHRQYIREHQLEAFPYVVSEVLGRVYGVSKLPYAVLIDEEGRIASLGIVNSREHLDSLFEAKERKVASIQEFMQRQQSNMKEVSQK